MSDYELIKNTIARLKQDADYYRQLSMWNRVSDLRKEIARLEAILNPKKTYR